MSKFTVFGGARLTGEINIHGAKNVALPVFAAALLTEKQVIIHKCPLIRDVYNMLSLLKSIGCGVKIEGNTVIIDCQSAEHWEMPDFLAKEIRSSIFMLGPVISRFKKAKFTYPGGCEIGTRPIDLHLKGLREMNIEIREYSGHIYCETSGIKGAQIHLDYPSVGATENIMMAAVKAKGDTVIRNAAREPEIIELQTVINAMGGKVSGAGTSTITIESVKKLGGVTYHCLADRIVAGTFMTAAVMTKGNLTIRNTREEYLYSIISKLREAGASIKVYNDAISVVATERPKEMHLIETAPYPGFPTDMQAQMCAAACVADGTSIIIENVFDNRFKHISELIRMGANITVKNRVAIVRGVEKLSGTDVIAMDLRGGAALLLAGLVAEGKTIIENVELIERGYEKIDEVLRSLGSTIIKSRD
jgi:UDP-N-acetylglucosamine 1-carboxyvinyltransferase